MFTMVRCSLVSLALVVAASCSKKDNSADTDQASQDLRKAQGEVSEHSRALAKSQDEIAQKKRELSSQQQQLTDQQGLVERQRQELGSAQGDLQDARGVYAAAVKERFAKLDASLASLATKTDAQSRDAVTGLRARRDQLLARLTVMAGTPDPSWTTYTRDVDITFDAIEHDLQQARK